MDIGTKILEYRKKAGLSQEEFDFPNALISIGDEAFSCCIKLTKLVLPNKLEHIGTKAFYSCSKLESIVIPISVTSVGNFIFRACDKLTIYCVASSKPSEWFKGWNYDEIPVVWGYRNA